MELDEILHRLGGAHRALRRRDVVPAGAVHVRLGCVHHSGIGRFVVGIAVIGRRAEPLDESEVAVIRAKPADDLVASGFPVSLVVRPRDLDGRLVGLRPAADGERAAQRAGVISASLRTNSTVEGMADRCGM